MNWLIRFCSLMFWYHKPSSLLSWFTALILSSSMILILNSTFAYDQCNMWLECVNVVRWIALNIKSVSIKIDHYIVQIWHYFFLIVVKLFFVYVCVSRWHCFTVLVLGVAIVLIFLFCLSSIFLVGRFISWIHSARFPYV